MTSTTFRRTLAALAGLAALAAVTSPVVAHADSAQNKDIASVRAATAKYHNEAKAIADGYAPSDECAESPAGVMGYHYVNFDLLQKPPDPLKPAILVYQPNGSGGRKLVAVEYFQPDADQDLATDGDRPSLFGEAFDGPMEGHFPGMPRHYDLHAWVWQHNPSGLFEEWNPAGSC